MAAGPRLASVQQHFADLCGLRKWRQVAPLAVNLTNSSCLRFGRGMRAVSGDGALWGQVSDLATGATRS